MMLMNILLVAVFVLISALLIAIALVVMAVIWGSLGRGAREEELMKLNAEREELLVKQQRALRLFTSVFGM